MTSTRVWLQRRCLLALTILLFALPGAAAAQGRRPARDTARAAPARRDTLEAVQPAPDSGRTAATDSSRYRLGPVTLPAVTLVIAPPTNPWRPYLFRSIGYAGAAGFGLLLANHKTSSTSEVCTGPPGKQDCVDRIVVSRPSSGLGLAIVAGAALAGIGDALLTSRRAHDQAERVRTGLVLPSIEPDGAGARIALLSWRF